MHASTLHLQMSVYGTHQILSAFIILTMQHLFEILFVCLFVCLFVFVALRPMSTAMVIAGRSVHLTTLFPGQA